MNRPLLRLALCAALASTASAASAQNYNYNNGQQRGYGNGQQRGNGQGRGYGNGQGRGGAIPLPEGVRSVVSIDAQNTLLVELEPQGPDGPSEYRSIPIQHVYSGGIARVLGGESIPTEEFVSPGFSNQGGLAGFGNQNGNFQGFGAFGNQNGNNFGGQNFGSGFNNFGNGPVIGGSNGFPPGTYALPNGGIVSSNGFVYQNGVPIPIPGGTIQPGAILPGGLLPGGIIQGNAPGAINGSTNAAGPNGTTSTSSSTGVGITVRPR